MAATLIRTARLPFLLVALLAACSQSSPPTASLDSSAEALTAAQCSYFAVNGKVRICHATGSAKNPFTVLNLNDNGCVNAHAGHARDYVASNDPTCGGQGSLPPGAPCDATLPCSAGYACQNATCQPTDRCAGVTCSPADQCHVSSCYSGTGACVSAPKVDGFECNDQDPRTQGDTCQAGVCVGTDPCTVNNGGCDSNATCSRSSVDASVVCSCNAGYEGNGTTCTPVACQADGVTCATGSDCCSGSCTGGGDVLCAGFNVYCGQGQYCPDGALCPPNPRVCTPAAPVCHADAATCADDADCCSGNCAAGLCQPAGPTCNADGARCTANVYCCSGNCVGAIGGDALCPGFNVYCSPGQYCPDGALCPAPFGECQPAAPTCRASGEHCGNNTDCCSGTCNAASGGDVLCPGFPTYCGGNQYCPDGTLCPTASRCQ